jgi:phosphatidylinositol phospholipase C delta
LQIVHQIFGKTLYCPDPLLEGFTDFPSPASLKNRIIISTKPPKEYAKTITEAEPDAVPTPGTGSELAAPTNQEEGWGDELPEGLGEDPGLNNKVKCILSCRKKERRD